jgi:PAS domain S-box-containing protein
MSSKPAKNDRKDLATIVDLANDAIMSQDVEGVVTSWNPAAARIFGYEESEALGQPGRFIVPPELAAVDNEVMRHIRQGEGVYHHETSRLHKDGRRIQVSVSVSVLTNSDGEIAGTSTIARDITETKRLERDARHLAAIVDSSDDAIISKDLNSIVTSWNAAAQSMFGYSADEMIGQSIRRIIPADRQQEEDLVLARIRRGERIEHYETVRQRKDGTPIPVSLTVSPLLDETGTIIGASKIARDISERQRAEEERKRLLGIARDASRLKDEFLATLSHELRTPLNAIVGYLRMMHAGLLSGDKQKAAMDAVVRNATSLTQIVEDVLDVSRIISGKVRLEVQPVELPLIVEQAVGTIRPAADAKGLKIDLIVDPQATPVSGDPERLRQIFWNLCSNAVKFTNPGGRVEVRLVRMNSHVEVTVTDTGIGIAPHFLPFVFDRFRQADAGIARTQGGLGLGLAISRHLVELQGGRIFVDSPGIGMGATFRVELPVRNVYGMYPAGERQHPHSEVATALVVPDLHGISVLAVDDDGDALALVREILEATGATVETAGSGPAALEKLKRMKPDMLVADLGMPKMDGFELIDRIRRSEATGQLPAIALTAFARSEDRVRALRSGFQLHLSKPIEPGELMAAIASLARPRRAS